MVCGVNGIFFSHEVGQFFFKGEIHLLYRIPYLSSQNKVFGGYFCIDNHNKYKRLNENESKRRKLIQDLM
jgi:hypothetical protein